MADWYGRYADHKHGGTAAGPVVDKAARVRNMADERRIRRDLNQRIRAERVAKGDFDPPRPVTIRGITIDDAPFVIDSWAKAYRKSATVGPIEPAIFAIEQRARINRLMGRSKALVACDAEVSTDIRGWILFEAPRGTQTVPIVHFVCVTPAYQLCGLGTALVDFARQTHPEPDEPMWCTHDTLPMRHCRSKWNLLYNPYLLELGAPT